MLNQRIVWRLVPMLDDTGTQIGSVLRTVIINRDDPHPMIPSLPDGATYLYAFVDVMPSVKQQTSVDEPARYTVPTTRLWVCGDWLLAPADFMGSVSAALITYADDVNACLDLITSLYEDVTHVVEVSASNPEFALLPTSLMPSLRRFMQAQGIDLFKL